MAHLRDAHKRKKEGIAEVKIRQLDASSGAPKLPHQNDRIVKNTIIETSELMPLRILSKFLNLECIKVTGEQKVI